jgi:hypothetical protein
MTGTPEPSPFERAMNGTLWAVMSWKGLSAFWERIEPGAGWYLYAVGEEVPAEPAPAERVAEFIRRIDALLRKEHHEDYCSIVYADDLERPALVKIYDPNHLGSSCGAGGARVLPGWVMSRYRPVDLKARLPLTASRRRWWQGLFSSD